MTTKETNIIADCIAASQLPAEAPFQVARQEIIKNISIGLKILNPKFNRDVFTCRALGLKPATKESTP